MINTAIMLHWQNWLFVGFVAFLVSAVVLNCKCNKTETN